jgi:hypothetical protein
MVKHSQNNKIAVLSVIVLALAVIPLTLSTQRKTSTNTQAANWNRYKTPSPDISLQKLYGDCNGDGRVDAGDLSALSLEINDGDGQSAARVSGGSFKGFETCDANYDYKVNQSDLTCLKKKIFESASACEEYAAPVFPKGDCNGDGKIDAADLSAITLEISDQDGSSPLLAQNGKFKGTQGCDANGDNTIDKKDISCTSNLIFGTSCQ